MDPETQAGTDHAAQKEQARLAMLRASQGGDASMDAEIEDDETDEVVVADQGGDESDDADEVEDADEADETEDEPDDDDDSDQPTDEDAAVAEAGSPSGKKSGKRKAGKVARLHQEIERLKAQNADLTTNISTEVERALAAKAEAEAALAASRADAEEDGKRIKQVRDYVHKLRGTDRELDALTREIASTEDLDPLALSEDQRRELKGKKARLNQIISARDVTDLAIEYADADLRDRVGSILGEFAKTLPGVDPDFHQKLKFGPAIQHVYDKAYERGTSESAKTIARHEKTIADLEGKLLAAKAQKRAPLKNVADGGTPTRPAPTKPAGNGTPMDNLAALGALDPKTGRVSPEFRRKLKLGQVSLAG